MQRKRKSFDFKKLAEDYNISIYTEGKNTARGWLNTKCPMCNDQSNHLGFNIKKSYFNCWECGWHSIPEIIKNLLKTNREETKNIIKRYSKNAIIQETSKIKQNKALSIPGSKNLSIESIKYLKARSFSPNKIKHIWDIRSTNHLGDYKFRIIAPIYFNNRIVSYQGRDITNKSSARYKACPTEKEIIHHKHLLYGYDYARKNKSVVVVEGITDVWRLGPGAVATFGTQFTLPQINLLCQFNNIYILFDEGAETEAQKLANLLSSFPINIHIITLKKDPAEALTDYEACKIMKKLLNKY